MKTKLFALVLVLALCLIPLTACQPDTPYSLYKNAAEKMEEANGGEFKLTMTYSMEMFGEKMETEIVSTAKVNGTNMEMTMTMDLGELAGEQEMNYVYYDNMLYMDLGEELGKVKVEADVEKLEELIGTTNPAQSSELPELTEEALSEIEIKENEDGTRSIQINVDKETILAMLGDSEMLGDPEDLELSDTLLTLSFDKDDTLLSMALQFSMGSDDLGTTEISMLIEYINFGTAPTISAPADADEYEEVDLDDMFSDEWI